MTFPGGFLWGAATAAHQVEGGNINCDSWLLEHAFMASTTALVNVKPPPSADDGLPATTPIRTVRRHPITTSRLLRHSTSRDRDRVGSSIR
jgi:hypothetical protein